MVIDRKQVRGELKVVTGNGAAAYGVLLCRPDVVAVYPITPQSEVGEKLTQFHADGILDAELVEVEGENSAMSVLIGASTAGGRVFTATSSWGLAYMHDTTLWAAGMRIPVVMVNVNREPPSLPTVACSRQDMMTVRDTGWIQIEAENCQEILDSVIMAYRLAEDVEILLPVMVSYDGFYLSYLSEGIHIPLQEDVDRFLSTLSSQPERPKVVPGGVACLATYVDRELATEFRYKHCSALERAKAKLAEIEKEFEGLFGRSYGGPIEEYCTDDAEIVLITMGSSTGAARVAVDRKRDQGIKVGLIKIRMFRPFPQERLIEALEGKKGIGIMDRSVCFGWNCGHLYMEVSAALGNRGIGIPMIDFIGGLAQLDITIEDNERLIEETYQAFQGKPYKKISWINLE